MIQGKRVILRPVEERDFAVLARWRNDPQNRRYFFSPFLINPGGQARWYERLLADSSRLLFMIDTVAGLTVGVVGLDQIDYRNQQAEIGQLLLDADQRGCGYAEEACELLLRYAFEELNLHRLYAQVFAFHRAAITWYKFAGFQEEGVLRQAVFSAGKFQDKMILSLLRQEWQAEQGRE